MLVYNVFIEDFRSTVWIDQSPLSNNAPTAESRYFTPLLTPCTLFMLFYNVYIEDFRGAVCAMYVM